MYFLLSDLAHIKDITDQRRQISHTVNGHRLVKIPQRPQTVFIKAESWLKLVMHNNMFSPEQLLYLFITFVLEFLFGEDAEGGLLDTCHPRWSVVLIACYDSLMNLFKHCKLLLELW
jgi:hypothetical protein